MILSTASLETLRPAHPSERLEAYRHRLAGALAAGKIDPSEIQFRECHGFAVLDAMRALWRGKRTRPHPRLTRQERSA
jgi:hypothetical protein